MPRFCSVTQREGEREEKEQGSWSFPIRAISAAVNFCCVRNCVRGLLMIVLRRIVQQGGDSKTKKSNLVQGSHRSVK